MVNTTEKSSLWRRTSPGAVRSGGKRGRGATGKTPFMAAVLTNPQNQPRKVNPAPVRGFRKRETARSAKRWPTSDAQIVTDGLACWTTLGRSGHYHRATRAGSGRKAARMVPFKWVNTTLGNVKSALSGTYRKFGPDHAGRYLASFAWCLQSPLSTPEHDPAPPPAQCRSHSIHHLLRPHRWMSLADKEVLGW